MYCSKVKNTHSFISLQFYLNSLNKVLLLRLDMKQDKHMKDV